VTTSAPPSPGTAEALALAERLAEDMAQRWQRGQRPPAEEYLARHPELALAPEAALELISEEVGLRLEAGLGADDLEHRFPHWRRQVRALLECHEALAAGARPASFPGPGEALGDFELLGELGRGAHARVFLARQPSLAGRLVVLKLGPRAGREHLSLARLQHTHVVPLYSALDFPERGLRGLCQPYFGGATLADLLTELAARPPAQRTGRHLLEALEHIQGLAPLPVQGPACQFLARASYVQAVCWLGACLADALQYAHDRGLLHLDLKPSNVLLAADGQPMLLDFHLARAPLPPGAAAPAWLGGTPGYMAPEHEAAVRAVAEGRPVAFGVDGRADVHALGRLLGEMLGASDGASVRRHNPRVSRGLADVLGRCLAADPARRYPRAADLSADLRRHLADLPVRGAPNSVLERWAKWRRRRPLALPLLVLLLGAVAAGALLTAQARRRFDRAGAALREGQAHLAGGRPAEAGERFRHGSALAEGLPLCGELRGELRRHLRLAERARAAEELHQFCEQARPLYAAEVLPVEQARAVAERCRRLWDERELVRRALTDQARADLLELAVLWVHLHVRLAPEWEAEAARREALPVLRQAEEELGSSCVLALERRLHEPGQPAPVSAPPETAWEHYAVGRAYLGAGDLERALHELDRAIELAPGALWPHYYRGCCAARLGRHDEAVVSFSVCQALAPGQAWCAYNRGLAHLHLGRLAEARRDLDRALRLAPDLAPAALARGALHLREKRPEEALADLERARRRGLEAPAVHYSLALAHLARGDRVAALASARAAARQGHGPARRLVERLGP
jgi:Tfp pilus assembly protein PilF